MAETCAMPPSGAAGMQTPSRVLSTLVAAFGSEVGETGYEISAARCCSEQEKATARQRGSSLLYGELLPDGVSKALDASRLGAALASSTTDRSVLELGMGSGKVATQVFLQCPTVRRILGVELVESRFTLGVAALQRLTSARPGEYAVKAETAGKMIQAEERATGRLLEFRCADFFSLGLDLTKVADVVFFAVNVPCKLFPKLCERLAEAKDGCRLFTYHALDTIWWADVPCPFHQVEANVPATDTFSTSWSPQGYRFYVYVCDRQRPPQIRHDTRNETFSEWQLIWDEKSNAYYFHNQESELSQWEVPMTAGCWQALFSEEHEAYYFLHTPSGHVQWEVPKCMADLGWGVQAAAESGAADMAS